ncbi:methionine sulfoxide [Schizosaccharomyces cryophilus OY26]|uniref:Peptide-methionine (R)-S-oxide reductase n=1 Tax=Schizosaccharomyces cryophilus (strain OY26 / ATCC MYA-4695 / CBS 11777 / NBRC 106824 / NRRL Y48691) TaxID=653667 RepID=S9XKP5_SCHCR|nr:methionine sulfoxide [Schizosaccharomyces cryophilus OY26]EPY54286.1 methionine sulfoxide [Schizosaccharomyces cryophilus OY26]
MRRIFLKGIPAFQFRCFQTYFMQKQPPNMKYPLKKSDEEWRKELDPEQYRVLRKKGTEPPGAGKFTNEFPEKGVFVCAACKELLYKADTKFESHCGWPAFYDSLPGKVKRIEDDSFGMQRTEVVCANCGGHLGHVFKGEGYPVPTNERHCINSVSLDFHQEKTNNN